MPCRIFLALDPRLHVVILGGSGTSYGPPPSNGKSWYQTFKAEVADAVDWSRVHFAGQVPYGQFVRVLQLSAVHVYLTYPFVLSWSLIEAMSLECRIVANDVAPVVEVARDGVNARLFPIFERGALRESVQRTLAEPEDSASLARQARLDAAATYDFRRICLPRWREFLEVPEPT